MRKFIQYFRDFHRDYFHAGMYFSVLLFIAAMIVFNYKVDFEDGWIDRKYTGTGLRPVFFFLTHAFAYYGSLLIVYLFRRKKDTIFTTGFWIKSIAAFALLGLDRSVFVYYELRDLVPAETLIFYFKCISNLTSFFTIMIPLILFKWVFDRKEDFGLYGITFQKVDFKPYWAMMAFMMVLLYFASLIPELQDYYPIYKRAGGLRFANYYGISERFAKLIFETVYLSDFIFTELFFRGLMIVGFARLLGKNAVIPMAATYCVLHFGKPMGETISSIFGGYILGVIALYSRNIWGGVFLHGGVALFMDLFALLRTSTPPKIDLM
ncbi:MAG: CPBP family intramembrane metalloprotease [Bacteroidetes bacterium]|nr:CPBP family intramembrane metalloprotease [Bacteroidota bacterium]